MPLKLVCPNCRADVRLSEPLPRPGAAVQCERCATALAVTYPPGVMEQLQARGKRFADASPGPAPTVPRASPSPASGRSSPGRGASSSGGSSSSAGPVAKGDGRFVSNGAMGRTPSAPRPAGSGGYGSGGYGGSDAATEAEPTGRAPADPPRLGRPSTAATEVDDASRGRGGATYEGIERTVGSMRSPYGGLPNDVPEPEGRTIGTHAPLNDDNDDDDPPETQASSMVKAGSGSGA
ncbi:MAG: hypothetical protein ABMB14_00860, partial [Myxococcota bacterium]